MRAMPRLKRPDGVELHWESRGDGPPVVLAAPSNGYPEVFGGLIADLAGDHRVGTYHLRGNGESTRTGPYDLDTDAADLAAVIEESGAQPAVVLGFGDGFNRAVRVAAGRPELVSALVGSGTPLSPTAMSDEAGLGGSGSVRDALVQMLEMDYRAGLRTILANTNQWMTDEQLRERIDATVAHSPQDAAVERLRAWIADEALELGAAVGDRLWILSMEGGNAWFSPEVVARMRELLPEARVENVAMGPISRPDLTAALVRRLTGADRSEQPAGRVSQEPAP